MGIYQDQILPRLQDKAMGRKSMREVRARVCADLRGRIVEVGFGTGLNVRYYPQAVREILAVEPSALCMRLAAPRIEHAAIPITRAGLDGQHLALPSEAFDGVVSTWTLCTIPDVALALGEIRRILKTGSSLHFVEHGHSPDERVAAWQVRIEPLNKRFAGGCHLTRDISTLVEDAGFGIEGLRTYYFTGEPKTFGYTYEGRAVKR
jgi:ubiquinone/menaquinone biosynthesis C-methylase UbiE